MFLLYATIYIFLLSLTKSAPQNREVPQYTTADDVLDSLLHLMRFFSNRYQQSNLDGIVGIRIAQSEVTRALANIDDGKYSYVSADAKSKLEKIRDLADDICSRALPELKKQDEKYFTDFLSTVAKSYKIFEFEPQRLKKMGEKFLPNRTFAESDDALKFNEESSDKCIRSIVATDDRNCDTKECWDLMTQHGTTLYYTTHQILYFQLGLQFGCQKLFEKKAVEMGGIERIFQGLCYNVIYQMETLFQHGTVKDTLQDIFLESGTVCGISGFMDALNITWLTEVMSWQDKTLGCFKDRYDEQFITDMESDRKLFLKDLDRKKSEWRKRNLLLDVPMGDSCSSHKSGVAAGYLAVHVRLFFEQPVMKYRLPLPLHRADMWVNHESTEKYYPFTSVFYVCIIFSVLCVFVVRSRRKLRIFSVFCRQ